MTAQQRVSCEEDTLRIAFASWLQHPYTGSSHWREALGDQAWHTDLRNRPGHWQVPEDGGFGCFRVYVYQGGSSLRGWAVRLPSGHRHCILGRTHHHVVPSEEGTLELPLPTPEVSTEEALVHSLGSRPREVDRMVLLEMISPNPPSLQLAAQHHVSPALFAEERRVAGSCPPRSGSF